MKKFQFSMQTLLDSREALEKAMQGELAAAVRVLDAGREKLRALMSRMARQIQDMESFDGSRLNHSDFSVHMRFLERIQHEVTAQTQKVAVAEAKVDEIRNRLYGIIRERKTLEKLKDKERLEWAEDSKREDQKQMDEVASTAYLHRRSGHHPHALHAAELEKER